MVSKVETTLVGAIERQHAVRGRGVVVKARATCMDRVEWLRLTARHVHRLYVDLRCFEKLWKIDTVPRARASDYCACTSGLLCPS